MLSQTLHMNASESSRAEGLQSRVETARGTSGTAIRCVGEFDAGTCGPLAGALERATDGDNACVLVDLTATTFVDCRTLTLIVAAAHRLADQGATLVLTLGQGQPRRLAELTGVADRLGPAESRSLQAG